MKGNIGNIPVLFVQGKTLPETWEKAVVECWEKGAQIRTEYDKPEDPPSRDCTMTMVIEEPFTEPRIHRAFPGSLEDLAIYCQEVVFGAHDEKWLQQTYTYHKRLFEYEIEGEYIDQINYIVEKLSQVSFSRRAQAITWNAKTDPPTDDPPCLQRVWCRLLEDDKGHYVLNMNTHWRSRDAYKAAFMNIFALTDLQRLISERISEKIGQKVKVGRYLDISDSFHIYGSYFNEFEGFLKTLKSRSFAERTWCSDFAEPFFEEARKKLLEE
ncbi:MAG: thymidylate synthase [Patescibacteria group bacterium]|nr:thymidylate synthase [Patescibacteria group bacterium]